MATTKALKKSIKADSGIEYTILESPKNNQTHFFELRVHHSMEAKLKDKNISKLGNIIVSCAEIRDVKLPLDPDTGANPREPSDTGSKSGVVNSMQDTITREPNLFVLRNGGITIVCTNFEISGGKIKIEFAENEGIVNGGHTYFAIENMPMTLDISSALAKIELIALSSSLTGQNRLSVITDLAVARNRNRAIDNKSSANSLGFFQKWKSSLGTNQNHILWKTGDRNYSKQGITAEEFIRTITVFDIKQFRHKPYNTTSFRLHKHATGAGPSKIHDEWFENTDANSDHLGHLIPIASDIMELRDFICLDFKDPKWNGQILPIRWTDQPTMSPTSKEQLWGSGFGNWIRYRSVKAKSKETEADINFLPSGKGKKGYKLPDTLLTALLGIFRDCIWAKHDSSTGEINLIGWYADPIELWKNDGRNILGAFKYKWNSIQDTVAYRKEDELYKMEAMEWGKLQKDEEAPAWLYDINDSNKKYVIENTAPTHHLRIHNVNKKVAKMVPGAPLKGEQGYILE